MESNMKEYSVFPVKHVDTILNNVHDRKEQKFYKFKSLCNKEDKG